METARQLIRDKERFRDLEMQGGYKHLERLRSGQVESLETSALHLDILRDLKRINSHLTAVAYPILDATGELRRSRLLPTGDADAAAERDAGAEIGALKADGRAVGR